MPDLYSDNWEFWFSCFSWEKEKVQHQWPNQRAWYLATQAEWAVLWDCEGRQTEQGIHPEGLRGLHPPAEEGEREESEPGGEIQEAGAEQQKSTSKTTGCIFLGGLKNLLQLFLRALHLDSTAWEY